MGHEAAHPKKSHLYNGKIIDSSRDIEIKWIKE